MTESEAKTIIDGLNYKYDLIQEHDYGIGYWFYLNDEIVCFLDTDYIIHELGTTAEDSRYLLFKKQLEEIIKA